jgi:hypothetical protein
MWKKRFSKNFNFSSQWGLPSSQSVAGINGKNKNLGCF